MKDNYNVEDYFKQGQIYSLIGDYNKALKCLDKAIDLDKTYRDAYVEKGKVYGNIGDYYNQIKLHTEEIRIFGHNKDNENNRNSYLNRASCYIILGQYDKAIDDYLSVKNLYPDYYKEIALDIANVYFYKEEYDKAIEYLDEIINKLDIEKNNISIEAHKQKGFIYLILEEYDKAIENFDIAIKNNEGRNNNYSLICYGHKSLIYIINKDIEKAKEMLLTIKNYSKNSTNTKMIFKYIYIPLSFKYIKMHKYKEVKTFYDLIDEIYTDKTEFDCINSLQFGYRIEINSLIDNNLSALIGNIFENNNFINLFDYKEKFSIWRLCLSIENLLQHCKVDIKNEEYVYHYTKATNLKFMLKKDNEDSGKFRLNNIIRMNDPQEGLFLKELFSKINKDLKLENIFNKSDKNFIYLASFSKKTKGNELPMWVHYGDSGKGLGFKFGSKFFNNQNIYMVQYLDETFNINESKKDIIENLKSIERFDELNELIDRLEREEKLKVALKEIFDIISNTNFINNKNKNFNNIVSILLNYVSFIFKDTAYEYEKEVRIIKLQIYKDIKIDESQDIPKLYMDFNEITKETCEGIIAGPKSNYEEIFAYCKYKGIKEINKSNIKYV